MIAFFSLTSCAPLQNQIVAINAHIRLEQYREDLAAGRYEKIIQQSRNTLQESKTERPADVAFYALGEVYAHHEFDGRNYNLSQYYFEELITNFPDSQLTSEAEMYISLFETIRAKEKEAVAQKEKSAMNKSLQEEEKEKSTMGAPLKVVEDKNFEEAVNKNQKILQVVGRKKPADKALYNLGLIYAHFDNPAKDYQKSKVYLNKLTNEFPDSEFAEEAQILLGLFETIEKMQQIDAEIEQQKKQLNQ